MALRALYEAYKESTKYPLDWLWMQAHTTSPQSQTHFQSTREIINAARTIQQRGASVPSSVIAKLSDAIKKRKEVLALYRGGTGISKEQSATHEAFIERLVQVRNIVSPLKAAAHAGDTSVRPCKSPESREASLFETLRHNFDEALNDDVPVLEDDELGQWIELSLFIYMGTLLECLDVYWEEAAMSKMPVAMAAALSTVALHAVDRISTRHAQLAPDATSFIKKWMALKPKNPKIRFKDMPDLTCQSNGWLDDQLKFHHVHQILEHVQTMPEYRTIIKTAGNTMSLSGTIHRLRLDTTSSLSLPEGFQEDDLALDKMQESMRQLLQTDRAIAKLEVSTKDDHICEPLMPFMRRITADTSATVPIALVFGMVMLLTSFKAFTWPDYKFNNANCRIKMLKFAREVKDEWSTTAGLIDASTSSKDPLRMNTFFLGVRASGLDLVLEEKRFDLYYQAPWTAGSHMNEILDTARFEGASLCFDSGYLSAVLHLHNALRSVVHSISPIPLLDRLCQACKDPLFVGALPSQNFSSHYRRANGQGFGRDKETGNIDCTRLAAINQNRRKPPFVHLCLFTELHNHYYQTEESFWMRVYSSGGPAPSTRLQKRSVLDELHSRPFNVALDKIKHAFLDEFQGEFPLARLNLCAVFRLCLKTLQELGAMFREQPSPKIDQRLETDASIGFSYVDLLLADIVEHLRDDKLRPLMKHWRELNLSKNVLANVGIKVSYETFFWIL